MFDIHPIIVHFPIAFLTIYALFELIRVKKLVNNQSFFYIKFTLLLVGTLGAFFALTTGEIAEEGLSGTARNIAHVHSTWANFTTFIFALLSVAYLIRWIYILGILDKSKLLNNKFSLKLIELDSYFLRSWLIGILAFIGLIALLITGALGGSIVYGSDVDPFVSFIYKIFIG